MKKVFFIVTIFLFQSCQVTETIYFNPYGGGHIKVTQLRDEQSYQLLAGENYSKEEKFEDTTYVFQDYAKKYAATFAKFTSLEKSVYEKYFPVEVKIKKSSYEKEFQTQISQTFSTISEVPDLYKTEDYADNIQNNYALSAEEHYYSVVFSFDGTRFHRIVKITDPVELKKQQDKFSEVKKRLLGTSFVQTFKLEYHFPKPIQSVSNSNAIIQPNRKSLVLTFSLVDAVTNPESTSFDVILK